jgi:hypothetical protein
MKNTINLDYSRVEVAVYARRRPMKLCFGLFKISFKLFVFSHSFVNLCSCLSAASITS